MLRAMSHVVPSHLMDRNLHPFTTLHATGVADAAGDIAFDDEPCAPPAAAAGALKIRLDPA
jgi:tRNA 2-thiocytidine biosynthesis protein TtcA